MSERLPYEDAFEKGLNDLSLPDSEQSWQKMKERLDEEDKKRRIIPPFFLSCAGWGALFLLVAIGGWLLLHPGSQVSKKNLSTIHKQVSQPLQKTSEQRLTTQSTTNGTDHSTDRARIQEATPAVTVATQVHEPAGKANTVAIVPSARKQRIYGKSKDRKIAYTYRKLSSQQQSAEQPSKQIAKRPEENTPASVAKTKIAILDKVDKETGKGSKENTIVQSFELTDSTKANATGNHAVHESGPSNSKDSVQAQAGKKKKANHYYLTAGIGEQQAINMNGQSSVPFNYYGRKNSFSDYIPSIYVRLHKNEKWFLQGEFRYGASQSVKEFSYSQVTKYDTASTNLTTNVTHIKKTYYHQLPLSINYNLLPRWSVGAGAMYSLFHGAITEQEIRSRNVSTGVETNVKQLARIPEYRDSFLYKTQWHLLFQTNYQWKRFSLGIRYQKDLQPFIKYTDPAGAVHVERNQSFDIILRYQLWRSKDLK